MELLSHDLIKMGYVKTKQYIQHNHHSSVGWVEGSVLLPETQLYYFWVSRIACLAAQREAGASLIKIIRDKLLIAQTNLLNRNT